MILSNSTICIYINQAEDSNTFVTGLYELLSYRKYTNALMQCFLKNNTLNKALKGKLSFILIDTLIYIQKKL